MAVNPIGQEISSWENKLEAHSANDFERLYDAVQEQAMIRLNEARKQEWFRTVDALLFHSHAYLQGSALQKEARERLIAQGRIFRPEITTIEDMQSLTMEQSSYISIQELAKGRLYAMAQGGAAGTGGGLLLGTDFPLQVIMNLRLVQLIAMGFGREIRRPTEMMLSLKVFQAATLPRRLQWKAWQSLLTETKSAADYMYQGNDELVDEKWLHQPIKQAIKSLLILTARKKVVQGIPLLGIATGAVWNYRLAKRVGEFSLRYYQKRCLL
ncbi:EcsC family protein [Sediminibacillus dalangtanensis]|uniref:EcsC family protein n=1 Tax=Sediminibacillus dalangtanensis TaxID=2729421 RepID=A0ABX7VWV0_9BACI|nr:EcsC family protein [Sediminibacillus dalangtanensis]QTN00081.1 EcsC family protein [Sediminibacillus dalangtanensis]